MFAAQFLLEGLASAGEEDLLQELTMAKGKHGWLAMLDQGATITMEAWNPEEEAALDWTHPWGAAPANIIPRCIMGIRPLEPGFSKALIQPLPGHLAAAACSQPTMRGTILVSFRNTPGAYFSMDIGLPPGMTAEVRLPHWALVLAKQSSDGNLNKQLDQIAGSARITVSRSGGLAIDRQFPPAHPLDQVIERVDAPAH